MEHPNNEKSKCINLVNTQLIENGLYKKIEHLERKVNQLEQDMAFWKKAHIDLQDQFIQYKIKSSKPSHIKT